MAQNQDFLSRLSPSQTKEIEDTRILRKEAQTLQVRAMKGRYDKSDFAAFLSLLLKGPHILRIPNPQLSVRAGLGGGFISSALRDRRQPKLNNMLRLLAEIMEIADNRLHDVDSMQDKENSNGAVQIDRVENLYLLAVSLADMAKDEIERLDAKRPNERLALAEYKKTRTLLTIFADGFQRIAQALAPLSKKPNDRRMRSHAKKVVDEVGRTVSDWWEENRGEAVDWTTKIGFMSAGIALLGLAGANMPAATIIIGSLVGGEKIAKAVKRKVK